MYRLNAHRCCTGLEVEVDIDTGQVTVKKMAMAVDCGVAINPVTASGQVKACCKRSVRTLRRVRI